MFRQRSSLNITQKFILYLILLSFLPLLVLGVTSYRASTITIREEASRYTAELVADQQDYLELQLAQIESLIANISGVEEITNALGDEDASDDAFTNLATQARIGYILNGYSNIKGLVSIDIFTINDGHYHVGDTLNVENIRTDVKDRIFAEALESEDRVYWAGIEDNVNANSRHKKVVTAAKVLTHINRTSLRQEPVALIIVNYSVEYLYEHFSRIEIDEGAYLTVLDAQDRIIFHPDKQMIGSEITAELKRQLANEHRHQAATTGMEINVAGEPMLISHIHSSNNGWIIMSLIPVKTLQAKTQNIGITTVLVSLMSLGIASLGAVLINKNVVNPIQQITNQFKRFQDGSLDNQIQLPVPSKDEIGELVEWFNVFVENLAARQKMERVLKESEEQYRDIFEAVTDGLIITNDAAIVMANSTACRMHGFSYEEFVALRPLTLIHPDYQEQFTEFLGITVNGQRFYTSVVNIRKDGTTLNVDIQGTPIDYQGQPHQLLIFHDITERLQTEEAMRRAQKLESLGVLAGGIAHDFNNLLVAMMAQTSLALVKLPPGSDAFPHIDKAVKAAEHAADLTRQMLAYSGRGQFERQAIDLNKLLEENLHLLEAGISKNVKLIPRFTNPLPTIEGDKGQMQQVVMNLIINAAEAIDQQNEVQGQVLVKTGVEKLKVADGRFGQFTGTHLPPGRYVTLQVEDNGCGMDDKTMTKIFDPFFTTKFTGRGLGLAAVQGIVRGHGGGLYVTSEVGQGTVFTILFPAAAVQPVAAPVHNDNGSNANKASVVLVIDDETAVREAVTDILLIEGIKTIAAKDGTEGVARYKEHHEDIQLVILDLSMPGLSGEETYAQLIEIDPNARVLISSGYSQNEVSCRFTNQTMLGFLQKPYKLATLIDTVQKHLS